MKRYFKELTQEQLEKELRALRDELIYRRSLAAVNTLVTNLDELKQAITEFKKKRTGILIDSFNVEQMTGNVIVLTDAIKSFIKK